MEKGKSNDGVQGADLQQQQKSFHPQPREVCQTEDGRVRQTGGDTETLWCDGGKTESVRSHGGWFQSLLLQQVVVCKCFPAFWSQPLLKETMMSQPPPQKKKPDTDTVVCVCVLTDRKEEARCVFIVFS